MHANTTCLAALACPALTSCGTLFQKENARRETRAFAIVSDLKTKGAKSGFYRDTFTRTEIEPGIWLINSGSLEVEFYMSPLGPFCAIDVETGRRRFEE